MKAVFDTNVLIDYLNGAPQAASTLSGYTERVISRITFLEVLAGTETPQEDADARALLSGFRIVELDLALSEAVVTLRKNHPKKMKLPDAIIYATARAEACPLVTRNASDFGASVGDVIEPYVLP